MWNDVTLMRNGVNAIRHMDHYPDAATNGFNTDALRPAVACAPTRAGVYLMYFVRNLRWKSFRMVSFTNLFFCSGSARACPLKTTSSFHLFRPVSPSVQ